MFALAQQITTLLGLLTLAPTGHGAVMFQLDHTVIYVDPYSQNTDYSKYPKADLILFTHDHGDHYDPKALKDLVTDKTLFVGPECMKERVKLYRQMANGDSMEWQGIGIQAVAAYNIESKKPDGTAFHPKGYGNGYIFTFGKLRVYVAGDTELIPEMKDLGPLDIAFLPKNQPYTMSDAMFVEAVKTVGAPVVYPVHYFEIDKEALQQAVGPKVKLLY